MRGDEIIVAVTGASGFIYAWRMIERVAQAGVVQHVLISDAARIVASEELGMTLPKDASSLERAIADRLAPAQRQLRCYALDDWHSPVASGSSGLRRMVVIPCSMGTLARIAAGCAENLVERAADVMLKEGGRLILVPRETPLSALHLENMLKLARNNACILPAMPSFYSKPKDILALVDTVVDRVLDHLAIDDGKIRRWSTD